MSTLLEFLPWLGSELDLARAGQDPAHQGQASNEERIRNYERLIEGIEAMQSHNSELSDLSAGTGSLGALLKNPGVLAMQVLEGLPKELRDQVRVGETEKFEASVIKLLRATNGQPMLLDNILMGLYLLDGDTYKRQQLNNKLYRMVQKGLIDSVPGKKGLYVAGNKEDVESAVDRKE